MKVRSYFLAGVAMMMLAACNNEPGADDNGKPLVGKGFMNISLNFVGSDDAQSAMMKAGTKAPDGFKPGDAAESAVKDIAVYYFGGEAPYKYLGKGKKVHMDNNAGTDGNVEKTLQEVEVPADAVKELENVGTANIIVVLNGPTELETRLHPESSTYEDFNAALEMGDNAGFMMTSVNYYPGGKETYFETIDKNNVAEEGETPGSAVEVYVERVCGKVTLDKAANVTLPEDAASVDIKGWGLNVRNTVVYPVKRLDESFTKLEDAVWPGADEWTNATAEGNFRSYWAKDPNYNDKDVYGQEPGDAAYPFKLVKAGELNKKAGESLYCLENTFNHDRQMMNETTTAVVYAQYIPKNFIEGGSLDGDDKTWVMQDEGVYYTLATFVNNFLVEEGIFKVKGEGGYESATMADVTFDYTQVKASDGTTVIGGKDYRFKKKENIALYKKTGEGDAAKYNEVQADGEGVYASLTAPFGTYVGSSAIYVNGYCYYEVPIRHFDEAEVPLAGQTGAPAGSNINDQSQLGRYGIVRNNWYNLTINSVSKPGKPIPGEEIIPPTDPDDPTSYSMNVTINILSWAVRNQGVDL